jgi:GNAT superfamily N-acetyltransferase
LISTEENVGSLIDAWKLMVGRLPASAITHARGVATMFGHVPLAFFNLSVPDRPLANAGQLREALAIVKERAKTCPHPSILGLCDAWAPPDWEAFAANEGFKPMMNMTGMAADQLLPVRRATPPFEFRRVEDETTARDLAIINAHAYGMPAELFECICNLNLWHNDSVGYVGYSGGRAVTCAAAFPISGFIYIALVATLPKAHGKGYAEAAMRKAIAQGREAMGETRIGLHASDMGQPLYRSMGFEPGARVVFLGPEGH